MTGGMRDPRGTKVARHASDAGGSAHFVWRKGTGMREGEEKTKNEERGTRDEGGAKREERTGK
jgi:hypothetical protein